MRKSRSEKLKDLLMETYRELYANCTTPVSFDYLVENSSKDEQGRVLIPYDKYFIDGKLYDDIVDSNMKKMRLRPYERTKFKISAYLGCGPTTINKENEDE